MRIATWNVNGVRARHGQLVEWLERDRPDVVCLQELKAAPEQLPEALGAALDAAYWCYWHGQKGYSGVGLHLRRERFPERPRFSHPEFDHETRIVVAEAGDLEVASVYVPNGGKDFAAKLRFLDALGAWSAARLGAGRSLVLCGDLNVARTDMDIHPKERKPDQIGTLPDERDRLERLLAAGLVDVGRALDPDNDQLFTWWAPWRSLRQRNIGWRIDYVLCDRALAARARRCASLREVGTSDHAPVVADFEEMAPG